MGVSGDGSSVPSAVQLDHSVRLPHKLIFETVSQGGTADDKEEGVDEGEAVAGEGKHHLSDLHVPALVQTDCQLIQNLESVN